MRREGSLRAGVSPDGFVRDVLAESLSQAEAYADFDAEADARWTEYLATGDRLQAFTFKSPRLHAIPPFMRILYHIPLSPFARKVRLTLAEKRLPFELRVEKIWERRPEFLDMNPAGTVPVLVEDNGQIIPDSAVICEYLDEAYPDTSLLGRTLTERIETRRLTAWFDQKFFAEVTRNLLWEKHMKPALRLGQPDAAALRAGYAHLKSHLTQISHLAEHRKFLAGQTLSLADFAAAAQLSALDFIGDVDWSLAPSAKDWYARMKSRPAFRALLSDRVTGLTPPPHYADLDF